MTAAFYTAGAIAVLATLGAITRAHIVHALLYLVVSFLGVAVVFYTLGAPFIAALEVIIYAGAIVVLFLFVVMLLNPGPKEVARERDLLSPRAWAGPALLALVLLAEMVVLLSIAGGAGAETGGGGATPIPPREVGRSLVGPYLLAVELAGMLLLAGLVAAYHVGSRRPERHDPSINVELGRRPSTGPFAEKAGGALGEPLADARRDSKPVGAGTPGQGGSG
jgi:NADH-quinone oxidoreductase subunit J